MKVITRVSIILVVFSILMSGCGAAPTSTPIAITQTESVSTEAPLAAESPIPTGIQPTETESTPGIIAIVPVAMGPTTLAATSDFIWVESHREGIVTRIDPLENKEVTRLEDVPVHCSVASGGGFVWAAQAHSDGSPSLDEGRVTKIDPASGAVVGSIELPTACGVAADDNDVWVTSPMGSKVVRYDVATLQERAVIPLGADVFEVKFAPEAVWVSGASDRGTVWRIDPDTNQVLTSISLSDPSPIGLEVAFDSVWVGSRNKGVIYRIDPTTNTITATIKVNYNIGGIGVGPDAIWASGFGDGTIYKIDPTTNSVLGSLSTKFWNLGPPLVAFESIWVGALDQNVVLRIDPAAFDNVTSTTP